MSSNVVDYQSLDNGRILQLLPQVKIMKGAIQSEGRKFNLSEECAKQIIADQTEETIDLIKKTRQVNRIRSQNGNKKLTSYDFDEAIKQQN